jgi:hypothetical protein
VRSRGAPAPYSTEAPVLARGLRLPPRCAVALETAFAADSSAGASSNSKYALSSGQPIFVHLDQQHPDQPETRASVGESSLRRDEINVTGPAA